MAEENEVQPVPPPPVEPPINTEETPLARLIRLLGFHPTRDVPVADLVVSGVFTQAVTAVKKKREAAALDAATKLIEQALDNQSKWEKTVREFRAQEQKRNTEFAKLVERIEALANGTVPASPETDDGE